MTALLLLAAVPVVMWLGQTVMLAAIGRPPLWRLDTRNTPTAVRTGGRILTQLSLVGIIVAYPLLRGEGVVAYYARLLPATRSMRLMAHGAAAAVLFLSALYLVWVLSGRVEVEPRGSRRRRWRRLALLLPTSLFGPLVEELLFRGVVMADLMRWLPSRPIAAFILAVLVFAGAHYIRTVKRRWTFGGHVMLGVLLCGAFFATGSLWLSIGLHAGGNLVIIGARPYCANRGPAWITGASIFPYAGLVGLVGLTILSTFIMTHYGPR